jgi:hypothetical protein
MNICSECGGVGGCKVGCAGPPKPLAPEELLRRQLGDACHHITQAVADYRAGRTHPANDYANGIAMGYTLALDVLHKYTHGQVGQAANFFPEVS